MICLLSAVTCFTVVVAAQHQPTPLPGRRPHEDPAAVERGQTLFKSSCGFCHGADATGARAPDLLRSATLLRDDNGNLLGPFIRNGRPDKGMPSFSTMTAKKTPGTRLGSYALSSLRVALLSFSDMLKSEWGGFEKKIFC